MIADPPAAPSEGPPNRRRKSHGLPRRGSTEIQRPPPNRAESRRGPGAGRAIPPHRERLPREEHRNTTRRSSSSREDHHPHGQGTRTRAASPRSSPSGCPLHGRGRTRQRERRRLRVVVVVGTGAR
jgi:hypothetical protein